MNLDEDLLEQVKSGIPWAYRSWEPERLVVVLGRGNKAEAEVEETRCHTDRVPILRRKGGGGTVVLSPGMLVISLLKHVKQPYGIQAYFQQINTYIIEALQSIGIQHLCQQGHSDICLRDRKILGSSMYRSRTLLFYTASLLVSNDLELIFRYLKHPSKEPEYRKGRAHRDFLTTIAREYPDIHIEHVKNSIDAFMVEHIADIA